MIWREIPQKMTAGITVIVPLLVKTVLFGDNTKMKRKVN